MTKANAMPASKYTYGREQPKSDAQKNTLINQFFKALALPEAWRFLKWTRCIEPGTNTLLSVGAVFRDMHTKGQDLRDYLVCFIIAPERGAICEKTFVDFGKAKYQTVVSNKTAEKLNEYIKEHYFETKSPVPESGGLEALREKIANL